MYKLITGGAGYIGSHVAKQLLEKKEKIIIIDNLSTGQEETLQTLQNIYPFIFIKMDLKDFDTVNQLFKTYKIDAILHFAASKVVQESVSNPLKYYLNNTVNTTNLINCAVDANIKKFIFSSTAAIYGEQKYLPKKGVDENFEANPINPYGMSKLMCENIIKDTEKTNDNFKYVIFRYFNVAGADIYYDKNNNLSPRMGESFPKATNLIKISAETASDKRKKMYIFGNDYNTEDGTCIRDYIHVDDLASAHIDAIEYLENNESDTFNIGYGKGYSVLEVINTMRKISSKNFKAQIDKRRIGDPSALISNNTKIKIKMHWKPKYENLELICNSAYIWEQN